MSFFSPLGLDGHALNGSSVEGINAISWMGNNTSKLPLSKNRYTLQHDFFPKEKKGSTLEKHLPLFINLVSLNVMVEFPFTLVYSELH
jgi:hypothetical protein